MSFVSYESDTWPAVNYWYIVISFCISFLEEIFQFNIYLWLLQEVHLIINIHYYSKRWRSLNQVNCMQVQKKLTFKKRDEDIKSTFTNIQIVNFILWNPQVQISFIYNSVNIRIYFLSRTGTTFWFKWSYTLYLPSNCFETNAADEYEKDWTRVWRNQLYDWCLWWV